MRRYSVWLCVAIALAGPFVVQAQVAYGFALAISEIGQHILESGQEIEDEAYDGRDLVSVITHSNAGLDLLDTVPLSRALPSPALTAILAPWASHAEPYWRGHRKWPPPTLRRQAILQTFLI